MAEDYSKDYVDGLKRDLDNSMKRASKADKKAEDAKAKLTDFENKLAGFESKFKGVDLDEVATLKKDKAEMLAKQKTDEAERLRKDGEFDQLLLNREAELKAEFDVERKELTKKIETLSGEVEVAKTETLNVSAKHKKTIVDNEIIAAAAKGEAIDPEDIMLRLGGKADLINDNGTEIVVLKGTDGNPLKDKEGKYVTMSSKVEEMKQSEKTAHLFKGGNSGAGSQQSQQKQNNQVKNPWLKEHTNLSERGRIVKENPELAEKFRAEAKIANTIG